MRSYAIQLFFDPAGEQRFRDLWDKAAAAAGTVSLSAAAVPHLTLLIFLEEEEETTGVTAKLEAFAQRFHPFPLRFSQAGLFMGREGVVYLAPVMTRRLFELHRSLHHALRHLPLEDNEMYLPDKWGPHCSVTLQATEEQMLAALRVLLEEKDPVEVQAVAIGLDLLPPATTVARFDFPPPGARPCAGADHNVCQVKGLMVVPQSAKLDGFVPAVSEGQAAPQSSQSPALQLPEKDEAAAADHS